MNRRLALITGGTSGIGFGVASKLAADHDLALVYGSDEAKSQASVEKLRAMAPSARVESFKRSLATAEDCAGVYSQISETFGRAPGVLVNSAGRLRDGLFQTMPFADFAMIINEHLVMSAALCQLSLKAMSREKFGRIINLSSISGSFAKRGQSNYAAAKAGIEGFTRTLALEVAHRGITVNAIAPGLIETPMTKEIVQKIESSEVDIRKRIPAARMGQPEEVGALAAFLCSTDAAYITGTVITIDGGRSLGDPLS